MINFGEVPLGSVLPIPFATYAASTGASVTLTGLATTDIEVYKGTTVTQRSSDAGYALIDTDGIDIDGITGIHGFSIDTGDNTDAGFFVAGSFYYVVVSAVTVDSQTVNFIAATFSLSATRSVAGVPEVDVTHFNGTAGTFASGRPEVNTSHIAGSAVSTSSAQIGVNVVNAGGTAWASGAITAASIASDAITAAKIATGAIDADAIAADAITAAKIADGAIDAATFATGAILDAAGVRSALGLASANLDTQLSTIDTVVDAILVDTGTDIPASLTTIDDFLDTEVAAIKAKTDSLTFTKALELDVNLQSVNGVTVNGDGAGTPMGV